MYKPSHVWPKPECQVFRGLRWRSVEEEAAPHAGKTLWHPPLLENRRQFPRHRQGLLGACPSLPYVNRDLQRPLEEITQDECPYGYQTVAAVTHRGDNEPPQYLTAREEGRLSCMACMRPHRQWQQPVIPDGSRRECISRRKHT